jgi:hypothetical protein
MVSSAQTTPLLRFVLVLVLTLLALAAGVAASAPDTGLLFVGIAFGAAPVAAMADGWARNRSRQASRRTARIPVPRVTRVTSVAPV